MECRWLSGNSQLHAHSAPFLPMDAMVSALFYPDSQSWTMDQVRGLFPPFAVEQIFHLPPIHSWTIGKLVWGEIAVVIIWSSLGIILQSGFFIMQIMH